MVEVKRSEHPLGTVAERDRALADYIADMCYVQQDSFMKASYLFNGFMHIFEDHGNFLPVAARVLKS